MSSFLARNPSITDCHMDVVEITAATVETLTITGAINANVSSIVGNITNLNISNLVTANALVTDTFTITTDTTNTGNIVVGKDIYAQNIYADLFGNTVSINSIVEENVSASNVIADYFIGGGSLLTSLPPAANIDIRGNVIAGQVNVTGNIVASNVYADYFIGGGSLLTSLPPAANIDIRGNVIAGQVNVTGNIVASNVYADYFVGNGAFLTDVPVKLPRVADIDDNGNIIGNYANMVNIIGTFGNIANVLFNASNVTAGFFTGNGYQVTGVTASALASNIGKLTGVYYVALNGNDSTADGSENKPFLTIQAAHDRALNEYPPQDGSISKQVEIRVSPGVYSGTTNVSRFNTVIRGPGSLYSRGQMAAVGQVNVNCANSSAVYNNTVSLENLFIPNGVTNTGNGFYTLNIDSCYIYSPSTPILSITNPNSFTYVNNSTVNSPNSNGTYVNITGNSVTIVDTQIQTAASGITSGYLISIGGGGNFSASRCIIDAMATVNAAVYVSSGSVPGSNPFKVRISDSLIQNQLGHCIDFGTTFATGAFIRNVITIPPGKFVFAGNGVALYNQQLLTPGSSNAKATTVTVLPFSQF